MKYVSNINLNRTRGGHVFGDSCTGANWYGFTFWDYPQVGLLRGNGGNALLSLKERMEEIV